MIPSDNTMVNTLTERGWREVSGGVGSWLLLERVCYCCMVNAREVSGQTKTKSANAHTQCIEQTCIDAD